MQRTFLIGAFLSSLFAIAGYGQSHGGGYGHSPGIAPVGSVGRAPIVSPFGRPLTNAGGHSIYSGYGSGYGRRNGGYGYGIGAYPVYIGGLSGDYYPGYTDPSLSGQLPYQVAPAPAPVVINQYFAAPVQSGPPPEEPSNMQVYSQAPGPVPAAPEVAPEPRSYLIAYKDHSVYSALAYWVEDHTLHYVTTQNTHNQADVTLIDLDFTKKLNQDRNMPFSLTPAQH